MDEATIDRLILGHLWYGHDNRPARPPHDRAGAKLIAAVTEEVILSLAAERITANTPGAVRDLVTRRFTYWVEDARVEDVARASGAV